MIKRQEIYELNSHRCIFNKIRLNNDLLSLMEKTGNDPDSIDENISNKILQIKMTIEKIFEENMVN